MPVDVLTETTIDRPLAEVASYVAEPSNAPEWYANIASAEWKTPPPLRLGSRFARRTLSRPATGVHVRGDRLRPP
jgi:hypothetical protein